MKKLLEKEIKYIQEPININQFENLIKISKEIESYPFDDKILKEFNELVIF